MENSDLSAFEKQRLANIQRNNAFLQSIGLLTTDARLIVTTAAVTAKARQRKEKRSSPIENENVSKRRSVRIQGAPAKAVSEESTEVVTEYDEDEPRINYDDIPIEPYQLDNDEFQVFVSLRAWRLRRAREIDTETYKVFHNRTLCEAVRLRRNQPQWGEGGCEELLECWGIGPKKLEEGGFAWELLEVLQLKGNEALLAKSRTNFIEGSGLLIV